MEIDERPFGPAYPLGFLMRTTVFVALACAIGLVILRWMFFKDLGSEYASAFYAIKGMLAFLLPSLVFCALAVLLVAAVAVFVVAVFASHKVAGPLFRLQRVAGHLQRKVLVGHIHLRTADQGKPVARALNDWGAARKQSLASLRERAGRCAEQLQVCERVVAEGNKVELQARLKTLHSALVDLSRN